jgi:5-methyltetrahydrofolate--homocysteine methyltransferase
LTEEQTRQIHQYVLAGNAPAARDAVLAALAAGAAAGAILQQALIPAMDEVGQLYEAGEYFVPEMLIAARAMKAGLAELKPLLVAAEFEPVARVAIGTVRGDLHDIGKNLVGMMLEGAGFAVTDLGSDVPPERFVAAVAEDGIQLLGLSALLTTTMPAIAQTIQALVDAGLRDRVKVIVGGAPVSPAYAQQIGADGYARDASRAADVARHLAGVEVR